MSINLKGQSSLRKYIKREYLNQYYNLQQEVFSDDCNCVQTKIITGQQGYVNPNISEAQRISQILQNSLGGRTTFCNIQVNELGGMEGQNGGMPRPPRNRF